MNPHNQEDNFRDIHKRTILYNNEVKKVGDYLSVITRGDCHKQRAFLVPFRQEIQTGGQSLNYGDRFIPRRYHYQHTASSTEIANDAQTPLIDKSNDRIATRNGDFPGLLRKALGVNNRTRQLKFTDGSVPRPFFATDRDAPNFYYYPQRYVCSSSTRYRDLDWICKPRTKPKVDANSSHEYLGFAGTAVGTQIEWAWTGHIVSYCEGSLLLWNPNEDIITKYDLDSVITLAYHPYCPYLATANHRKMSTSVNVWTFKKGAMLNCFSYRPKSMVTSLCWHKHGVHLLTGNTRGVIGSLDFSGTKGMFHRTRPIQAMIRDIKFSATAQYVASLDIIGKVCIWSYNSGYLKLQHVWDSGRPTYVSMDWHPWTDFDIVLCVQRTNQLIVLNILSKQAEAYSTGLGFRFDRPVVSFNRSSAELAVVCRRKGKTNE